MNDVTYMLNQYNGKSPRASTFAILYGNLILNICYGVIYVLLHKTLFLETWTNIAIVLAFTESVILFYAVITVHDRKFFMLGWTVFTIILNSTFIIVRITRLMKDHDNWDKEWHRYVGKIVIDMNDHLGGIFSYESVEFLSKNLPPVIQSFLLISIVFKYYSAWAIYQSEVKRKTKTSEPNIILI